MVIPGDRDLDRQFDVERLGHLRQQLDLFELQATVEARTCDVFEQAGHFGIAGQLPQQHDEGVLHLFQLPGIEIQVRRHAGLAGELLLECRLFLALEIELAHKVAGGKVIAKGQHQKHEQGGHQTLDRRRPGTHVAGIQIIDVDLAQPFEPFGQAHLPPSGAAG
ncbi:hypothetical protein D3C84_597570 [compost metagenome]